MLVALAVNKDKRVIEKIDYVLNDPQVIVDLGIKMEKAPGQTPDALANDQWHFDLIELTVSKIVSLAQSIKRLGRFERKREPDLKRLIVDGYKMGHFDMSLVKPDMKPTIQRLISDSER